MVPWPRELTEVCIGPYSSREMNLSCWGGMASNSNHGSKNWMLSTHLLSTSIKQRCKWEVAWGSMISKPTSSNILPLVGYTSKTSRNSDPKLFKHLSLWRPFQSNHCMVIFKWWYLFSLTYINRLSAWFPTPSHVLLIFDSLVRGKWHLDVLKNLLFCHCVWVTSPNSG